MINAVNQDILNKIIKSVSKAFQPSAIEFIDILIENFTHTSTLLEVLYLKHLMNDLPQQINHHNYNVKYQKLLDVIGHIHSTVKNYAHIRPLFFQLNSQHDVNFKIFESMCREIVAMINQLAVLACDPKLGDNKVFTIDQAMVDEVEAFISRSSQWYTSVIISSPSFKDFVVGTDFLDRVDCKKPDVLNSAVNDPQFMQFMQNRKVRLNINSRRVF